MQAISELVRRGKVTRVVSQNVDGLHLRSGIPRDRLAELHGNCFAERCHSCKKEYIREFEIETVRLLLSNHTCTLAASLRDIACLLVRPSAVP